MNSTTPTSSFVRPAGWSAIAGGLLGLTSMVAVFAGEARLRADFLTSSTAVLAGWATFAGIALLALGLAGIAVRLVDRLPGRGRVALAALTVVTAVMTGAEATQALVLPDIAARLPGVVDNPPPAVPPTFLLGGVAAGVCALVLAVSVRRAGLVPTWVFGLLVAGAVVVAVPLPSPRW